MQLYYIQKFHVQLILQYLYLLFSTATCFGHKSGHHQGATSFIDVYSLCGNLSYVDGGLYTYWCYL
jgi:hypothetical protein